jgi:hypothetical protein
VAGDETWVFSTAKKRNAKISNGKFQILEDEKKNDC